MHAKELKKRLEPLLDGGSFRPPGTLANEVEADDPLTGYIEHLIDGSNSVGDLKSRLDYAANQLNVLSVRLKEMRESTAITHV